MNALVTALVGLAVAALARAEATSYQGVVNVASSAGGVTCQHHHDWSRDDQMRLQKIMHKADMFSPANTSAWISCSKGDAELFKSPAPALTKLVMSDDGRFVAGVTTIKVRNPAQIAIWETVSGTRLFTAKVDYQDACFSPVEYAKFLAAHPLMREVLTGGAVLVDGVVHADIVSVEADKAALNKMVAKRCPSYIAKNISGTLSTYVFFYADAFASSMLSQVEPVDPLFRMEYGSDGKPAFLTFLDIKGVPARVDLHPQYIDPVAP